MLDAYIGPTKVATFTRGSHELRLQYCEDYLAQQWAFPISASLPLTEKLIENRKVRRYLENLLPETRALGGARQHFHEMKNPVDPLSVLAAIGADTPGALSFYPSQADPDNGHAGAGADVCGQDERDAAGNGPEDEELTEDQLAEEIRQVRSNRKIPIQRFTLAGAQPKTAYRFEGGRWYRPSAGAPSTHIFKPALPKFEGLEFVEHATQRAAAILGLSAAKSEILNFAGEQVFVSTRFDRCGENGEVRLHQEDLMQALGWEGRRKYQANSGPGVKQLIEAVRMHAPDDEDAAWRLLAFNVASSNCDAHGKNYSFLIDHRGHRLAPAYDLNCLLPYPGVNHALSMSIGRQYNHRQLTEEHWKKQAKMCKADPGRVLDLVRDVYDTYPSAMLKAIEEITESLVEPVEQLDIIAQDARARLPEIAPHRPGSLGSGDGKG